MAAIMERSPFAVYMKLIEEIFETLYLFVV